MIDGRFQLASSQRALGRLSDALATYQGTLGVSAPAAHSGILVEIARVLVQQGELDLAAEHARQAQSDLPTETSLLLSEIAAAEGDLEGARQLAERALASESLPRAETLLLLGRLELAQNRPSEALVYLDQLSRRVTLGARQPVEGLEFERAQALARSGQSQAAVAAFEAEIAAFPSNPLPYAHLAVLAVTLGQAERVDPLLEAMVAEAPAPESYLLAAQTVERLGNSKEAERWRARAAAVAGR